MRKCATTSVPPRVPSFPNLVVDLVYRSEQSSVVRYLPVTVENPRTELERLTDRSRIVLGEKLGTPS